MDAYHQLLDMWLAQLPKDAIHLALKRSGTKNVVDQDIDDALRSNLKHAKKDALTFGVGLIPAYNRALFDAAEVLKSRLSLRRRPVPK